MVIVYIRVHHSGPFRGQLDHGCERYIQIQSLSYINPHTISYNPSWIYHLYK